MFFFDCVRHSILQLEICMAAQNKLKMKKTEEGKIVVSSTTQNSRNRRFHHLVCVIGIDERGKVKFNFFFCINKLQFSSESSSCSCMCTLQYQIVYVSSSLFIFLNGFWLLLEIIGKICVLARASAAVVFHFSLCSSSSFSRPYHKLEGRQTTRREKGREKTSKLNKKW